MKNYTKPSTSYLWRVTFVEALILFIGIVLGIRVVFLHVADSDFLRSKGDRISLRKELIPTHRGMVMDRHGEPLAVSTPVISIWANPKEMLTKKIDWAQLSELLSIDQKILQKQIEGNPQKGFVYLKRQLAPEEADIVLNKKIAGIYGKKEYRRYYPAGDVTSHLLGFTNIDDQGQEGIELAYNDNLQGEPGKKQVLKDRLGHIIKEVQEIKPPRPGQNLDLSIDLRLQYLAYRELKESVIEHKASAGSAVILDAKTGEVLAMVNYPTYNPNNRQHVKKSALRNSAVTDVFEPGSTIKPFTVAAALESGLFEPTTLIDTNPGQFRVSNKLLVKDHHNYGVIDVTTVITKSSNIASTKMVLAMGGDSLRKMLNGAGLGKKTAIQFPGERSGVLPKHKKWRPTEEATMSYGYGLSVTPLQLAQAYLAFANHGQRPDVTLLKRTPSEKIPMQHVMPSTIADEVLRMMETVTHEGGTATRAAITAYRVAGKTGTAVKLSEAGGYEKGRYMAFFAGLVPVSDPAIVAVVMIDDPRGKYYGGEVAAPFFAKVIGSTLRLMSIAPDALPETAQQTQPMVAGGRT
jgi:cell division protein FtsI (penicillin-binding protein 3)